MGRVTKSHCKGVCIGMGGITGYFCRQSTAVIFWIIQVPYSSLISFTILLLVFVSLFWVFSFVFILLLF